MGHALRAVRLNLKHGAEDHPVAAVVVGVALASGAFFGLLALAHGCETKVKAEGFHRRDAEGAEKTEKLFGGKEASVGGCGVVGLRTHHETSQKGARTLANSSQPRGQSGWPPISLQAVAVPLVEGLREAPAGQPAVPPVGPGGRHFRVTAYCPCEKCCGAWADGITASDTRADHRLVAAPREFPFGTVMAIPGYGTVRVEDRGGAIRGDRLDVLFPTHAEALVWGVRWMDVEIGQ